MIFKNLSSKKPMCGGKEYAMLASMVVLHNLKINAFVKKYCMYFMCIISQYLIGLVMLCYYKTGLKLFFIIPTLLAAHIKGSTLLSAQSLIEQRHPNSESKVFDKTGIRTRVTRKQTMFY